MISIPEDFVLTKKLAQRIWDQYANRGQWLRGTVVSDPEPPGSANPHILGIFTFKTVHGTKLQSQSINKHEVQKFLERGGSLDTQDKASASQVVSTSQLTEYALQQRESGAPHAYWSRHIKAEQEGVRANVSVAWTQEITRKVKELEKQKKQDRLVRVDPQY